MVGQRPIELQELSKYFNMPEKAVAKSLGICLTSLKKICRQHGVTRWPYRKIKSLDKKLRKLEVAMSTAKEDPSMVFAKWGEGSGDAASQAASPPCSDDASFASTPRQMTEFSPSPDACHSPVDQPLSAEMRLGQEKSSSFSPIPVRLSPEGQQGRDEPIKIELSLTPSMLQSVASGGGNISFVVQGVEGLSAGGQAALTASFASSLTAAAPVPAIKVEPEEEPASGADMSDEELIAMLAMCAGTEAPTEPHKAAAGAAAPQLELSDAEIMQALAGCCEAPSSFSFDSDDSALGDSSSSCGDGGYMSLDHNDADFHAAFSDFSSVC